MENQNDIKLAAKATKSFLRSKHIQYLLDFSKSDSYESEITDYLKMSGIYWVVSSLSLLDALDGSLTDDIVQFYRQCVDKESGGVSASIGHDPHILYTLSGVQTLILLDKRDEINVDKVVTYVKSLQNKDGSFCGDKWGEIDTRFSFCAIACLSLLDRLDAIDVKKATEFVVSCQNMDGGFGSRINAESHAGLTYCCVGTLAITKSLDLIDTKLLGWWLAERQCSSGGFNGRPEKLPDLCYSWWVLASLKIIEYDQWVNCEKLTNFILMCQDGETGGFADRPGNMTDPFHTLFGVGALSLLGSYVDWDLFLEKNGSLFYLELSELSSDTRNDAKELEERLERVNISRRSFRNRTYDAAQKSNRRKLSNLIADKVFADPYEVVFSIGRQNMSKFGRRAKLVEVIFGLSIVKHCDGEKVIIDGFIGPESKDIIEIGDWLHSLNGIAVCYGNIEEIIRSTLRSSTEITLGMLKGQKEEPLDKKCVSFPKYLINDDDVEEILTQQGISVVYIDMDKNDTLFQYPKHKDANFLVPIKGVFLTMNDLMRNELAKVKPICTLVHWKLKQLPINVFYKKEKNYLLLVSFPLAHNTIEESTKIFEQFTRILLLCYQSFHSAFSGKNGPNIYHLLSLFFARMLFNQEFNLNAEIKLKISKDDFRFMNVFEDILSHVMMVPLPKEPLMQLNDALNELEAADFSDWNDDAMEYQRQFAIIGSCLYHNGYLLASHINEEDLIEINTYLKTLQLLQMSQNCCLSSLVIWFEVYLKSCGRNKMADSSSLAFVPNNRTFLLIVGSKHDLLVTLLEKGIHTENSVGDSVIKPDPFYIDEIQETLRHIQCMNVTCFADKWVETNCKTNITLGDPFNNKLICASNNWNFLNFTLKKPHNDGKSSSINDDVMSVLTKSEHSDDHYKKNNVSDDSDSEHDNCKLTILDSSNGSSNRLMELKLTSGDFNVLLHFVQLNNLDGVLINSIKTRRSSCKLFESILNNFRKCALLMHEEFLDVINYQKSQRSSETNRKKPKRDWLNEQGVSFELREFYEESGKLSYLFKYWVVGKLTKNFNELYVCYQDSIPQNLVEIALKIHFNC